MHNIKQRLTEVRRRIADAARAGNRKPGAVRLIAVSKTHGADRIRAAIAAGQHDFGESYVQEALGKIQALRGHDCHWHFIGPIQSNKTRAIAERFDWVHSVDRLKIARRLSDQRPAELPALQVCLQIDIDDEYSKSGIEPGAAAELAAAVTELPRLQLRGLMTIPAPATGMAARRRPFAALRQLRDALAEQGFTLDTLSMGMSADLEAAVAEGATILRVGTAIFGPRR